MTQSVDTGSAGVDVESVRRLVEIVVEHNLAELDYEVDGVQITIKGAVSAVIAPAAAPPMAVIPVPAASAPKPAAAPQADARAGLIALEAPMMGTFYRAPSPTDPAYVNPGDTVRVGQTVCQIEAMKVFSDVPAEASGRVVEIMVENGKLVHMGDPLMYLEPL